jgi:two-component system, cell cycle sensor histidine kinase and response regulator CckA
MSDKATMRFAEKIFNATSAAVVIFNPAREIVWTNKAFKDSFSYDLTLHNNTDGWSFLAADQKDRFLSIIGKAFSGNLPEPFDVPVVCSDGVITTVRWSTMLIDEKLLQRVVAVIGVRTTDGLDIAEQKKTEAALKQSEERFRALFDHLLDGVFIHDFEGNFLDLNQTALDKLGYDRDEIVSLNFASLLDEEQVLKAMHVIGEIVKTGVQQNPAEFKLKCKDGSYLDVENKSSIVYKDGKASAIVGIAHDITERKRAEETILREQSFTRALLDSLPGVFYLYTYPELRLIRWNKNFETVSGFGPEEMSNRYLMDWHIPELKEPILNAVEEVMGKGKSMIETSIITKDGRTIPFLMTGVRFEVPGNSYLMGVGLDITERKRAEEALRESEERYRRITENMSDFVSELDAQGIFRYNSPSIKRIMGYDPEELIGSSAFDLIHPEDRDQVIAQYMEGVRTGSARNVEQRYRHKNGTYAWLRSSGQPLFGPSGEHIGAIVNSNDISEQKRLEEERRKLEQELFQAQKMDAIGKMAGGLAHDFNNILTGIQGNAALMMMECQPERPHYQRLSHIEEHVKRGANLTRQLLGFAREGKYEAKTLSINDLLRKSVQFFIDTRKEIEADFELQDDVYPAEADAGQIEQVLLNIFINAGHAMAGGGHLHIQTTNITVQEKDSSALDMKPGDYVKISISDTGTGMDEETLNRIFEPFFTTKSQQGGTGLGLASAYGIIWNHGGVINAYSEPGQGATFNVYLPASKKKNEEKKDQISRKGLLFGSGGILLIDDEPMILDTTSRLLIKLGYTIYSATSGQEALSIYLDKRGDIDLVILDMIMPVMSGSEVLKMLKAINPDVRVILSSGYSMQGEVKKVVESGCRDFIQKPYIFTELSKIVHRVMTGREERDK